jgi:formylmethanofuran dehydrogenase subunit B
MASALCSIALSLVASGGRSSIIDHASGDGLDCRRANIRFASHAENMRNRRHGVNNTSGYKGVHWHDKSSKWRAQIRVNGKNIHLGVYSSPEAAAQAYRLAAAKYHGDFARAA